MSQGRDVNPALMHRLTIIGDKETVSAWTEGSRGLSLCMVSLKCQSWFLLSWENRDGDLGGAALGCLRWDAGRLGWPVRAALCF